MIKFNYKVLLFINYNISLYKLKKINKNIKFNLKKTNILF